MLVDATLGAGGHTERFLTQFPGLRVIGLDRDPDALQIAGARLAPFGDRVTLVRTRYDGIADALARHPARATGCRRGAVRPRRLVDAAGPRRAWLLLLVGCAAGHADGPGLRPDRRRRSSTPTTRGRWPGCCASSARSGSPAGSPPTSCGAAPAHRSRTTGELVELLYEAIPAAGPAHRRPPGQAHLPGAADRGQRRAGVAAGGDARRAGGAAPGRADRGDGLPVAGGPDRQDRLRRGDRHRARRPGCRSNCPGTDRSSSR